MEEMAARLGYGSNVTYNTVCDLPGLYCLASRQTQKTGAIVKTKEFNYLFIQGLDDLGMFDLDEKIRNSESKKYNFKEPADI